MKSVRKIDELGRIVLPLEMRRDMELKEGVEVAMVLDGGKIILSKESPSCTFCGDTGELQELSHKHVCQTCMARLND